MDWPLFWLLSNLLTIVALAFYSMIEMACVSVNKARLHFYAVNGSWRAQLLQRLLNNPSWLFSTTLIGVNVATVFGSECAREFHASIGLDPDLAPISQVILVVIFGELAPMFAARKFSEHVALLGAPLLYLSAKLLFPITWSISYLTHLVDRWIGGKHTSEEMFLTQEELIKMVEEQETAPQESSDSLELSNVASSLFKLHNLQLDKIMIPLSSLDMLPTDATITQLRNLLKKNPQRYTPVYHRRPNNVVGILQARDVLRAQDHHRVSEYAQAPWFITTQASIKDILTQFRRNKQRLAVVIDSKGTGTGFIFFSSLINKVFGMDEKEGAVIKAHRSVSAVLQDKTLSANMTVEEFNEKFGASLGEDPNLTLGEIVTMNLGHHPNNGDSVVVGSFKITVKSTTLLDIKSVTITSLV